MGLCCEMLRRTCAHTHRPPLRMGPDYIFPNKWLSRRLFTQPCIMDRPSPRCTPDGVGGGVDGGWGGGGREGEEGGGLGPAG